MNNGIERFDCVAHMRQVRDSFSEQIAAMPYEDLTGWLRAHRYSDPRLQKLSEKAAQRAGAAEDSASGRARSPGSNVGS